MPDALPRPLHPIGAEPRMAEVVPLERHTRRRRHDPIALPAAAGADRSAGMNRASAAVLRFEPRWEEPAADDEGLDEGEAPPDDGAERGLDEFRADPRGAGATRTHDDATLAALLQRIADQDARALEALYDATVARVHGLVLRVVQRRAWAEEAVEDTYWQVWRQAARFDAARGRPLTWLLAIARTRAIDLLRREQRFQHESLDAEGDDGQPAHEGARTPMHDAGTAAAPDLLEATRDGTRLHAALATLDARSRQLLALAFFRGLTHEEIATQEQMPLGSVKSVIRRALQQLRQKLDTDAGDLP